MQMVDKKNNECCDTGEKVGEEEAMGCLLSYDCPVLTAIAVIGGKWKIPILYALRNGSVRFSDLQRSLEGVTQKMLTQCLRELENDGLVNRKVYAQVPPRVEYSITSLGLKLEPILYSLCEWGMEYQQIAEKNPLLSSNQ